MSRVLGLQVGTRCGCKRFYTTLRSKGPILGLDHFIQRKKALALWRDIVRATNKIQSLSLRNEMRQFARDEFNRNRQVTDITHIRYLISTGKTTFDTMKRYVDENAG